MDTGQIRRRRAALCGWRGENLDLTIGYLQDFVCMIRTARLAELSLKSSMIESG